MRKAVIEIGQLLHDSSGSYEVTAFKEFGNSFCTVRECIYEDESDEYTLGDELFFTLDEVKHCLHFETSLNYDEVVSADSDK